MGQYTYTLNPDRGQEEQHTYKQSELEKMTLFHLREICRKERLVIPSGQEADREGLVRLIVRYRGRREYRHIKTPCSGGMERLQEFLGQAGIRFLDAPAVDIPGTITLYRETELNELDGYRVHADEGLYCGNLLLVDEALTVYTCFYLGENGGQSYLCKGRDVPVRPLGKHQYFILYFPNAKASEFLYDCYQGSRVSVPGCIEGVRVPLLDIREEEVQETDLPLVIDFGSCNTTMGICLPDGGTKIATAGGGAVIPSVIGVREGAGGEAEFLFGYEAVEMNSRKYKDEDTAVFYDIKRWVSDIERQEEVVLGGGYKYRLSRKDMLGAYLAYLLDMARQQFKLRFTQVQLLAPIRQKEKFRQLFEELLPEYTVRCELDEGMAVLFHTIHDLIGRKAYEERRWYHALVIDCGGGTTDLTSGRFQIENNRVSYIINLETRYENGDTNFGGNNLTYRILQLLKLRIVEAVLGQGRRPVPISGTEEWKDAYQELEAQYRQAERRLPTCFREYEEKSREQYFFVKSNYYYLFGLAEEIKRRFFGQEICYELKVSTEKGDGMLLDKWKLSLA